MGEACNFDEINNAMKNYEVPKTILLFLQWSIAFLSMITWIHAPFLILMPFFRNSIKTNSRQIIAMITLSDLCASLLNTKAKVFGFPENKTACFAVSQLLKIARNWSEIWSMMLLLNVCLVIDSRWKNLACSKTFLILCHLVTWPYGFIITFGTSGFPWIPIADSSITEDDFRGCHANFSFEYNHDKTQCAMVGLGRKLWFIYFANLVLIMALSLTFFIVSWRVAQRNWVRNLEKSVRRQVKSYDSIISEGGYGIAADFSLQILKTTKQLSLTAFIYTVSLLPTLILRAIKIFSGFIFPTYFAVFFRFYPALSTVTVGALNVMSYFYLSPCFRREVWKLFSSVFRCEIFRAVQRYQTINSSSRKSTALSLFDKSISNELVSQEASQYTNYYETYERNSTLQIADN